MTGCCGTNVKTEWGAYTWVMKLSNDPVKFEEALNNHKQVYGFSRFDSAKPDKLELHNPKIPYIQMLNNTAELSCYSGQESDIEKDGKAMNVYLSFIYLCTSSKLLIFVFTQFWFNKVLTRIQRRFLLLLLSDIHTHTI